MGPRRPDVAVLGLGVMGSAIAWRLAQRGLHVVGVDQHEPAHGRGSSHGGWRLSRTAYPEGDVYVPLVRGAMRGWDELASLGGPALQANTGALWVDRADGETLQAVLESARRHAVDHALLDETELRRLVPGLRFEEGEVGLLDRTGSALRAERCVLSLQQAARAAGAGLRFGQRARWSRQGGDLVVEAGGERLRARHLVIASGPWTPSVAGGLLPWPLRVERVLAHWFDPGAASEDFRPGRFPVTLLFRDSPVAVFPADGDGVKVACHPSGVEMDPEAGTREVDAGEEAGIRRRIATIAPALAQGAWRGRVCMYTSPADRAFHLRRVDRDVVLVAACSGHGFKFAPAIGEGVASLVTGATPEPALAPFVDGESLTAARADRPGS